MKKVYKRKAWLLDDGMVLDGYVSKRTFYPYAFDCGFSSQKFKQKDIGKIIFFNKGEAFLLKN